MKRSIWTDEYIKLRKSLKKIRLNAKLSQYDLSVLLDKPRTYVTKYENADRNLDFFEVLQICKACDVDPHDFLSLILKNTEI